MHFRNFTIESEAGCRNRKALRYLADDRNALKCRGKNN
jgi:hypothetical protein